VNSNFDRFSEILSLSQTNQKLIRYANSAKKKTNLEKRLILSILALQIYQSDICCSEFVEYGIFDLLEKEIQINAPLKGFCLVILHNIIISSENLLVLMVKSNEEILH
jgi:hypothetical protein